MKYVITTDEKDSKIGHGFKKGTIVEFLGFSENRSGNLVLEGNTKYTSRIFYVPESECALVCDTQVGSKQ